MERSDEWRAQKKMSIKQKIARLSLKIPIISAEIVKFGPKKKGFRRKGYVQRNGMIRNWHKMACRSLMATRRKIYRLQEEAKRL